MANPVKEEFLTRLRREFGGLTKLPNSQSLYEVGNGAARIYIRYSKVHDRGKAFFGLRRDDLHQLEGHPSAICFLWDGQAEPLLVPYSEYEEVFRSVSPAADGQFKVQIYLRAEGNELYIANAGRFSVEAYSGWGQLSELVDLTRLRAAPDLSHSAVQTLLASIGASKGFDIWIPRNDRQRLDWTLADKFDCAPSLPSGFSGAEDVLAEVDVIWIHRGAARLRALFEVEHSTPIYSGLLRLNDVHLTSPGTGMTYGIVSNDDRRSLFVRQVNRPTFRASGLAEQCTFMEYANVYAWHERLRSNNRSGGDRCQREKQQVEAEE
ncbi:MAG: hypothetical protein ACLQLG_17255 [Thermoguttaceae bacterium]